jgi:hypothetical protein
MVVSLAEIKKHVAIDVSETHYDSMLTSMEAAAVEWIQSRARILLRPGTVTVSIDKLPSGRDPLYIPVWPVTGKQTQVSYVDINGDLQEIDTQSVFETPPASFYPAIGETWPEVQQDTHSAVTFQVSAGYSTVPEMVNHAIKMLVAHWFRNRETVLVGTISKEMEKAVDALMVQFRRNFWSPFGVYQ